MPYRKKLKIKSSSAPKVNDAKGVQESFSYVLQLVQDKWTISEAVELANVSRAAFYKHITPEQKNRLWLAKSEHLIVGSKIKHSAAKPKTDPPPSPPDDDDSAGLWIEPNTNTDWDF